MRLLTQTDIAQIKALPIPIGYRYNASTNRYMDSHGNFVAFSEIYSLLDVSEQATEERLQRLTAAYVNKELSEPAWYLAYLQELQRLHVQSAALGAGGFDNLTPKDFGRVDRVLREDAERLVNFARDIRSGKTTGGAIEVRVHLYVGNAHTQFWAAQKRPRVKRNEIVIERRDLTPGAEHCEWCVYLVDLGWQLYGSLPYPGETSETFSGDSCLTNCRCRLTRKTILRSELSSYLGTRRS